MENKMALTWNTEKAIWEFTNDTRIVPLTANELSFIQHAVERNGWESGLDDAINDDEDNLDLDMMSRDELIELCMDELESKWECRTLDSDPDYAEILFDVAQENGIWRD